MTLYKILKCGPSKVFVLLRQKHGTGNVHERFNELIKNDIFDSLPGDVYKQVIVVEGDMAKPLLELSIRDLIMLRSATTVSHWSDLMNFLPSGDLAAAISVLVFYGGFSFRLLFPSLLFVLVCLFHSACDTKARRITVDWLERISNSFCNRWQSTAPVYRKPSLQCRPRYCTTCSVSSSSYKCAREWRT